MSLPPLVSIAIPAFNAGKYIAKSVDSVLNQTYKNFELIIIDDGSKDDTAEYIRGLTDSRVRKVFHPINEGIVATRNEAMTLASGKYLFWMDADDISHQSRIEKQVAEFERKEDLILCGTWAEIIDEKEIVLESVNHEVSDESIKANLFFGFPFLNPSVGMRMDVIRNQKLTMPTTIKQAEDYVLYCKMIRFGQFANLPYPLYKYRVHENENRITSFKNTDDIIAGRKLAWNTVLGHLNLSIPDNLVILHDKASYYLHFGTLADMDNADEYFGLLQQISLMNKKIACFNQQLMDNLIAKQARRLLLYKAMPLLMCLRLQLKFFSLMPVHTHFEMLLKKPVKKLLGRR